MGTWTWNATAYDNSGLSTNSSTQSIILLNLSETLSQSTVNIGDSVTVSGHIELTNGTNVSNTVVYIYQNGSLLVGGSGGNFSDFNSTHFDLGTYVNTTVYDGNVILYGPANGTNWTETNSSAGWSGRASFGSLSYNDSIWIKIGRAHV